MAYWNAIKTAETSEISRKRRRRDLNGLRFSRKTKFRNRRDGRTISEGKNHVKNAKNANKSYVRFQQKGTGRIIVANYDIQVKYNFILQNSIKPSNCPYK